jgi:ABC-type bacteriocin/lantibiotic exporter with double-glycine peptidase domain
MPAQTNLPVAPQGRRLALETRHFRQSHAMCGPTSLRIVLAYFGRTVPEKAIARACRSSDRTGTTGQKMIRGAQRLGFPARIIDGANLQIIQRLLAKNTPVIVDWMSAIARRPAGNVLPCGHYSVVCGLDRRHIVLQDPAVGRRRHIVRQDFLNLWFDFVGVRPSRQDLIIRRLIVVDRQKASSARP